MKRIISPIIYLFFFAALTNHSEAQETTFNTDNWDIIGRGEVNFKEKAVEIDDCLIASNKNLGKHYEIQFTANTPIGEDQVQIWSGFGFQDRDNRYALGLRGGNNNDIYLCRYQSKAKSILLGIESLEFYPVPGESFIFRIIFSEGHILVFINKETQARMIVYDENYLSGGSSVLGGGWIPTVFNDYKYRILNSTEAGDIIRNSSKRSSLLSQDEREELRVRQRKTYKSQNIKLNQHGRSEIDLTGDWLFIPEHQAINGNPYNPELKDQDWHLIQVPAFWNTVRNWLHLQDSNLPHRGSGISDNYRESEDTRISQYTFDAENTSAAWYRHYLIIPEVLSELNYTLHFDAISKVADVYINGHYAGGHIGMFGAFELDISPFLKKGKNLIAVNVKVRKFDKVKDAGQNVARAVSVDITNDMLNSMPAGMFRGDEGGIWQAVKLITTPQTFISDVYANVNSLGGNIEIEVRNSSSKVQSVKVQVDIYDLKTNEKLCSNSISGEAKIHSQTNVKYSIPTGVINPKLWSPENPNLYKLITSLYINNILIDQTQIEMGFRTFEAIGNKFYLNGYPYYIRGANHPPCGIAPNDQELANRFFELMHQGNQMVTRSHGCPFTEPWMNAADQKGVGVSYEGSWPWLMISNIPSDDLLSIWKEEMIALVKKYRNHPSLLIWTINNEMYFPMFYHNDPPDIRIKKFKFVSELVKEIRELSPNTVISFDSGYSRVKEDYENNLKPNNIDDGDIDDRHVYFSWYNRDFFQVFNGEWDKRIYWSPGANPDRPFFSQETSTGYTNNDDGHYNRKYLFNNYVPQSWVGDWAYEDHDPAFSLNRHAFMTKELMEAIRRTSPETAGVLLFANNTWYRNVFDAKKIEPYPIHSAVQKANQPVLVSAELFGRNFYAGDTLNSRICIVNNDTKGKEIKAGKIKWTLESGGQELTYGFISFGSVGHYEREWVNSSMEIPVKTQDLRPKTQDLRHKVRLKIEVVSEGKVLSENEYELLVAEHDWVKPDVFDKKIGLYDITGETAKALDYLGVKYIPLRDLTQIRTEGWDLVIVANLDTENEIPYSWEDVRNVAKNGMNFLLIHPGKHMQWLMYDKIESIYERPGRVVNMHIPEHPAFDGIEPMELAWWQQNKGAIPRACKRSYRLKNENNILSLANYLRPHTGLGGVREETYFEMFGVPLLEVKEGKGIIISSEMELNMGHKDPIAGKLLSNLILFLL